MDPIQRAGDNDYDDDVDATLVARYMTKSRFHHTTSFSSSSTPLSTPNPGVARNELRINVRKTGRKKREKLGSDGDLSVYPSATLDEPLMNVVTHFTNVCDHIAVVLQGVPSC